MMFLKIAWGLITGNLAGIVTAITGTIGKLSDNDTTKFTAAVGADKDVAVAQLQTSAAIYHSRVDMLKGMRATQWLIIAATVPPIYHQALIFLDSCPFFLIPYFPHVQGSWKVAALPGPYAEREWELIASLLGINTALGLGMGALKAWRGR